MVFLDSSLPDGVGSDMARYISEMKQKEMHTKMAIVSMSGNSLEDQKEMYKGYKIAAYVQKPLSRQQILGLLGFAKPNGKCLTGKKENGA